MQFIGADLDEGIQRYPPAPFQKGDPVWYQPLFPIFMGQRFPGSVDSWRRVRAGNYCGIVRALIGGRWYPLPVVPADIQRRDPEMAPLRDVFGRGAFDEPKTRRRRRR